MKTTRKLLLVLLALIGVGFAKLPIEQRFAADLRERHLIQKPINLGTRQELGQTAYAVALGGLRSLVAASLNLKAYVRFEHTEWGKLEGLYNTITTLQPHSYYYWDTASWHLAYNAYADYADKPNIPDARRRYLQKEYLARGIRFLEEGIENNPEDLALRQRYVDVLTDPFKPNDLPKAVEIIREVQSQRELPRLLHHQLLYALSRIPGRGEEAWQVAQELWTNGISRDTPSIRLIYFSLQWKFLPPDQRTPLEEIFGPRQDSPPEPRRASRQNALKYLSYYWRRKREGFPMDGVRETIELLLQEFKIPAEFSPLNPGGWRGYPAELFQNPEAR